MVINMKICGVIVEYNPMHNGHVYHIQQARKLSKCDVLVAVMSGNYMQRGEPAIIDKFSRTEMALQNGIDLVVELPFVFATQSADAFAYGAISILDKLGVDELYFGSEAGNISSLIEICDILDKEEYNQLVKEQLNLGNSYPTASNIAMSHFLNGETFSFPNNILGIQYIKAIRSLQSKIQPFTIQRIGTGYYDELSTKTNIQSATAIRRELVANQPIDLFVPQSVANILQNRKRVVLNDFTPFLQHSIASKESHELHSIFGVEEGIENRMIKYWEFDDIDSFIDQIISRRYTNSNLRRMILHLILNVTKEQMNHVTIDYIRILGMNRQGQMLLNRIKKDIDVPIYTKISEGLHPILDLELRTSKVYSLVSDKNIFKEEFKPVIYLHFD